MAGRDLVEGDILHDDRYGDLTVVAVVDEFKSGIGTVVFEVTDGLDAFDVIEGVCVRIGRNLTEHGDTVLAPIAPGLALPTALFDSMGGAV